MNLRRFVPKSKLTRYVVLPISILVAILLLTYLLLLAAQAYSAVQAATMLDRLEFLRIGSSQAEFERAVRSCKAEQYDSTHVAYVLTAGAFRAETVWKLLWKLPDRWAYRAEGMLSRAGLRWWRIHVSSALSHDGRLERVSVGIWLTGRYETLGADWQLSDHIRPRFKGDDIAEGNPATYMHWYHITSDISGEGFRFYVTPASSPQELQARRINRKCLISFRGCDGFCELLPDAARLLRERHDTFGGCTSVPRSWCEIPYDACRKGLEEIHAQTKCR